MGRVAIEHCGWHGRVRPWPPSRHDVEGQSQLLYWYSVVIYCSLLLGCICIVYLNLFFGYLLPSVIILKLRHSSVAILLTATLFSFTEYIPVFCMHAPTCCLLTQRNAMRRATADDFTADGWRILDAYTPTVLRADSHIGDKDCLHYCVPGPADHWATLLYNMLLADRDRRRADKGKDGAGGAGKATTPRSTRQ